MSTSKCATLKHGGRFGGSLSPNPRNIAQPTIQPPSSQQQAQSIAQQAQQQNHQHIQLQQHHLQKPNNQQLELQTYQLQQQNVQQHSQGFNVSTVSQDYTKAYPTASLPYKKPPGGFSETSSILKKHREEVSEMTKPHSSVFSIETSSHRQSESKGISIQQQPLPEIPQQNQQQSSRHTQQVLNASTLASNSYPANYRSLQRPQATKQSYSTGTTQRNRESRPAIPAKVNPPILPPKNRNQSRAQQPLPSIPSQSYNHHQQQQYPSRSYERERSRDREKRSYDDSHQYRASSKQQQQQIFGTLPHHHHHPTTTFASSQTGTSKSSRKSDKRGSRELLQQPFENYSATEL